MSPRRHPLSRLRPAAVAAAVLGWILLAAEAPAAAPRYADTLIPASVPSRSVVYHQVGGRELRLFVFEPAGRRAGDRRTAFLTVHGGGWSGGDPSRMFPFAAHFARRGCVAFSVEYRRAAPAAGISVFDGLADVRAAVRAVRRRAGEFGVDPARVVVHGASAGGHLAVGAALFEPAGEAQDAGESSRPDALVLFYPVIDTSAEGYGQTRIGARWREISPVEHVRPGLPPTLVCHGTADTVTPVAGVRRFAAAMLAAGNRCELELQEGGGHGYLLIDREGFDASLRRTEVFLHSTGLLPRD